MRRVLATFLYYFRWQRLLAWTTSIGLILMLFGKLVPPWLGFFPVLFGSVLAFGFPATFAGIAFREIISNRRFVMVPEFQSCAAGGLLLFALASTGVTLIFANEISPDIPLADPLRFALLAFSIISAYLLISQWLVIYSLGLIGFVVLPLVVLRLWITNTAFAAHALTAPWLLAAIALLGWAWLIVAVRRPRVPRPVAASVWGQSSGPELQQGQSQSQGHEQWLPRWGRASSAVGTIMRGMLDGFGNRLAFLLMAMLMFPVTMWLVLFLLGVPRDDLAQGPFNIGFFMIWSLLGIGAQASTVIRDWPARLRYVWLRTGGDRNAGWRLLERSLLGDIMIIAGLATLIALPFSLFSDVEIKFLGLYVMGCVVITWFASYAGFWTRASNWHELVHTLIMVVVAFACFGAFAFANKGERPEQLYWLITILGALTIIVRALAKFRVTRIDWCAVRPARIRRKRG